MRHLFIFFVVLFTNNVSLIAQDFFSGVIYSPDNQPLAYANILLHRSSDSTIVKVGYSEEDGRFIIFPQGDDLYYIEVNYLNMETYFSSKVTLAQNTDLGKILLTANNQLDEVVVIAQQSLFQIEEGKTILNVNKSILAAGQNALDLLKIAPGISIGIDNQISLFGKTKALIYVNGRRSEMGLQNIPSDQIQSIEIISNPSAKYDAEGNAGVINILLKKAKDAGWKGSIIAGTSYRTKFRNQLTAMTSFHEKKISFTSSVTFQNGTWLDKNILTRTIDSRIFESDANIIQKTNAISYRAGIDYNIIPKATIGILWQGLYAQTLRDATAFTDLFSKPKTLDKILNSTNSTDNRKKFNSFNINYLHQISSKTNLNFDINYGLFYQPEVTDQPNQYFDADNTLIEQVNFHINAPSKIDILSSNIDISHQIIGGNLDLGLKTTLLNSANIFDFFHDLNGQRKLDSLKTNTFTYVEKVQAGYFDFSRPIHKSFKFSIGLRVEYMDVVGSLVSPISSLNKTNANERLDWFPAASFSWTSSPLSHWNLAFTNRINRPNYYKLNPFEIKLDELNGQKGNPFLKPEYAHSLDLTFSYNRKLQIKIGYSIIDQVIARVELPKDNNRSFLTWTNLEKETLYNANISYPFSLTKKIVFQTSVNIFHKQDIGQLENSQKINLSVTGFDAKFQSRIPLPKHFTIEWMGMYQSPTIWEGTFELADFWRTDMGISKALFQGRGSLKLVAADIFHSQKLHMTSNLSGQQIDGLAYSESNQFRLFFTYQFGNDRAKSIRRRATGIEGEKGRIRRE